MTTQQRSYNMSCIHGKDTKPELIVRRYLWSHGFRYRLNYGRLPGKPDVVLKKYRTCVFVNGCFWHGHRIMTETNGVDKLAIENSECCKIPKTNRVFWVRKIMRNRERDAEVQKRLAEMGWHCITVWECELKHNQRETTLQRLVFTLNEIWLNDMKHHKPTRYTANYTEYYEEINDIAAEEEQ